MVALVLPKEQKWWLHGICIAKDRDCPHGEQLSGEHADWDEQNKESQADHRHRHLVGGVHAYQLGAVVVRVAKFDHDAKGEEEN